MDIDAKATFKELSFQEGDHILHRLFWQNLAPAAYLFSFNNITTDLTFKTLSFF